MIERKKIVEAQTGMKEKIVEDEGQKSPEKEEMTDNVMAERAAEWGLVLKSDAETGKTQGVTTRRSGDNKSTDRRFAFLFFHSSWTSSSFCRNIYIYIF